MLSSALLFYRASWRGRFPGWCILRSMSTRAMELDAVVTKLKEMFPLELAEEWDNVGLLVEPSDPAHRVSHIMLTNDLTEKVLDEINYKCTPRVGLVVAYHPPIFQPLKKLIGKNGPATERIIIRAVESRLAVYSPHTAADAYAGGINDWLASGLGAGTCKPIRPVNLMCEMKTGVNKREDLQKSGTGRLLVLEKSVKLSELLATVKKFLGLERLRLALGNDCTEDSPVTVIAICAGSGATALKGVSADVYLTGEMSHHHVLEAVSQGVSVILCEHSNTERGYLAKLQEKLQKALDNQVVVSVSKSDRDPLDIV